MAVKVALSKSLKFLVVDTAQSAEICSEFLKEKQIQRDVLILANLPEREVSRRVQVELSKCEGMDASLIYDVIEVSRG